MVNIQKVKSEHIRELNFPSKEVFINFVISKNIKSGHGVTIDDLKKKIKRIIFKDEESRRKKLQEERGENYDIITQNMVKRSKKFEFNPYSNNIDDSALSKLQVIFIKIEDGHIIKKLDDSVDLDSDSMRSLIVSLKQNFKPVFGDDNDLRIFKENVLIEIRNHFDDDEIVFLIYNNISIRTVDIYGDTNYLLYYVSKSSSYRDFGDVILHKFCIESEVEKLNYLRNTSFGCFFRCLFFQSSEFFSLPDNYDKLCHFDADYTGQIEINQIDIVAKAFQFNITVLDVEFNIIRCFKHKIVDKNYNRNIYIVRKDGHVYSLRSGYNKSALKDGSGFNHLIHSHYKKDVYVNSIKKDNGKLPKVFKDHKISIVYYHYEQYSNNFYDKEIVKDILYNNNSIFSILESDLNIFYVSSYKDIIDIYDYFRNTKNIIGCLKENFIKGEHELKIIFDNKELYFRTRDYLYFDSLYHPSFTFSYSNVAKYLFQTFIKEPIKKKTNIIVSSAYKSLCTPLVKLFNTSPKYINKYIYLIDLKGAYRFFSGNLNEPFNYFLTGVPKSKDDFDLYFSKKKQNWFFKSKKMNFDDISAYIPIKKRNINIVKEFNDMLIGECIQDNKIIFNCLVGSMHPGEVSQSLVIYFNNRQDFDRFVINQDKKKYIDFEVNEDQHFYKVRFLYEDLSTHYQNFNLVYFATQIIQKCKKAVFKIKKKIERENKNTEVVMCLTDSCMIVSDNPIDISKYTNNTNWELKSQGRNLYIKSVGKYCITDQYNKIVHITKHFNEKCKDCLKCEKCIFKNKCERCQKCMCNINYYTPSSIIDEDDDRDEFEYAYRNISSKNNFKYLVKGSAGCGKTHYIKTTFWNKDRDKCIVLGMTGVSASSLNSFTFHSFFGLKDDKTTIETALNNRISNANLNRIKYCEIIVIDEAYLLKDSDKDKIDTILRFICCSNIEFGGKKMYFIGDDKQLPCVGGTNNYMLDDSNFSTVIDIPYNNNSRMNLIYKTWTDEFRTLDLNSNKIKTMLSKVSKQFSQIPLTDTLTVFYKNKDVEEYNEKNRKNKNLIENGEPIILNRNLNIKGGFFNGCIGTYLKEDDKEYIVKDDKKCLLKLKEKRKYEKNDDDYMSEKEEEDTGDLFSLAYAITIHKVQGLTLEKGINIGFSKFNTTNRDRMCRLLYVALTRVRDFSGVYMF